MLLSLLQTINLETKHNVHKENKINNNTYKKRYVIKILLSIAMLVIIVLIIPLLIEKLIMGEEFFPIISKNHLCKDIWFGFMGSYIGAIGTVILGIIAIEQSKKYKDMSDVYSEKMETLQNQLKDLTEQNLSAIKTLEKINMSIYTPIIEKIPYTFYKTTKQVLDKYFDNILDYQMNYINIDFVCDKPVEYYINNYKTFGFIVRNTGEKVIRNLQCCNLSVNGKQPGMCVFSPCDIMPGRYTAIILANIDLVECTQIDFNLKMNNLLKECYIVHVHITAFLTNKSFEAQIIDFSMPIKHNNIDSEEMF